MVPFLSCDWGSTSFRLRLMAVGEAGVLAQVSSPLGASVLAAALPKGVSRTRREQAFAAHLSEMMDKLAARARVRLAGAPVIISGMVTSAHGWRELPYARIPFAADGSDLVFAEESLLLGAKAGDGRRRRRRVFFLSGMRAERDVIRGEEAEIIGLFQLPEWRDYGRGCLLVMPGTHSKHVWVARGRVTDFCTFMTGELYAVLAAHSVLRHTVPSLDEKEPAAGAPQGRRRKALVEGVRTARELGLSRSLFLVRTNGLFRRGSPQENAAFLSGLLIGDELMHAAAEYPQGPILLCAGARLRESYEGACRELGLGGRLRVVPAETTAALSAIGHRAFAERHLM